MSLRVSVKSLWQRTILFLTVKLERRQPILSMLRTSPISNPRLQFGQIYKMLKVSRSSLLMVVEISLTSMSLESHHFLVVFILHQSRSKIKKRDSNGGPSKFVLTLLNQRRPLSSRLTSDKLSLLRFPFTILSLIQLPSRYSTPEKVFLETQHSV